MDLLPLFESHLINAPHPPPPPDTTPPDTTPHPQSFFAANPRFASNPFYVFGESYGGHYVPAVGHRIFAANQQQPQEQQTRINLAGLGIGNGLTDPEIQYEYYAAYGVNNTYGIQLFSEVRTVLFSPKAVTIVLNHALILFCGHGQDTVHKIERALPRCVSLIQSCQHAGAAACVLSRVFCSARILDYFPFKERNVYDIRKACDHPPLCYDFDNVAAWLARPEVREVRGTCIGVGFGIAVRLGLGWIEWMGLG